MPAASTIIIIGEDFSIPGSPSNASAHEPPTEREHRFFALLEDHRPDVIVLDLTRTDGAGLNAIRAIRERSGVPVLVIHSGEDAKVEDYRVCGAASCIPAPIDIVSLNGAIQRIIGLTQSVNSPRPSIAKPARRLPSVRFGGIFSTLTRIRSSEQTARKST